MKLKVTAWQLLPSDAQDFEEAALCACELVLAGDPRIGKVPARRASRSALAERVHRFKVLGFEEAGYKQAQINRRA
jgi:hypothetical protein